MHLATRLPRPKLLCWWGGVLKFRVRVAKHGTYRHALRHLIRRQDGGLASMADGLNGGELDQVLLCFRFIGVRSFDALPNPIEAPRILRVGLEEQVGDSTLGGCFDDVPYVCGGVPGSDTFVEIFESGANGIGGLLLE